MGEGEWGSWSNMHADYFGANQPELNEELLDLCLRDAPEGVLHADPRCGSKPEGGTLKEETPWLRLRVLASGATNSFSPLITA